jgi:hypothetical protein
VLGSKLLSNESLNAAIVLYGAIFIVIGLLYWLSTFSWAHTWRCTRCAMEFDTEEAAKGHTVICGEHKTMLGD